MKKSFISLLSLGVILFGTASCSGKKAKEDQAAKTEEAAVIAGNVSKSLLTEELKTETLQFLADMPATDIPYLISTGEVEVGVGNTKYMLPVSKMAELTSMSQKARACGMYFADYNVLKLIGQPTTEVEGVLAKLTTDLNISFILNILKEEAPKNATKEQTQEFYRAQENKLITAMGDNNKIDVAVEFLGGSAAEYACLFANPSLVVKGDATSAGLSDNMLKRVDMLIQTTSDLSEYYPDMQSLGSTIAPLTEKVATVQTARNNNAEIMAIRDNLLK